MTRYAVYLNNRDFLFSTNLSEKHNWYLIISQVENSYKGELHFSATNSLLTTSIGSSEEEIVTKIGKWMKKNLFGMVNNK